MSAAGPGPGKNSRLTPEVFGKFLYWLSPEPEQGAKKYLEIRTKLIRWFRCHGCLHSDELADEVLDRAAIIVDREPGKYSDPTALCCGVAKNVLHEYYKRRKEDSLEGDLIDPRPDPRPKEQEHNCLSTCLENLPASERELYVEYHRCRGQEKIKIRQLMAREYGGVNKLRIKAHRIGKKLNHCISGCMQGSIQ